MKKKSARTSALEILIQFEQKQAYSNLLLNHYFQNHSLSNEDKRLCTELVYGVIQRLNTLDWIANRFVKKGTDALDMWVHQLIRLGLYQLIFLDRIPARAAVYETVQIAKKRGHQGIAKFVNGVLRAYLRQKDSIQFPSLAIQYSYPSWLVERMIEVFGESVAIEIMKMSLNRPQLSVRVNRLKMDRDQLLEIFSGRASKSSIAQDGLILREVGNPALSSRYQSGFYTVQDESSMLVVEALNPQPDMKILDACAAPGGKTTHIAERMNNQGEILACDQYPHKVQLISSHAKRLGIDIIRTQAMDMTEFKATTRFDAILLDAPCSGLGVIRRKPEIKWRKEAKDIQSLLSLQRKLLDVCATHLKPGGTLLYSTCTWEPLENQEQIKQFLERHPRFKPDLQLKALLPETVTQKVIHGAGWIQILPHHFQTDGFFIARLIKQ